MITSTKRILKVTISSTGIITENLYFNEFPVHLSLKKYLYLVSHIDQIFKEYKELPEGNTEDPIHIKMGDDVLLALEFQEMKVFLEQFIEKSYRFTSWHDLNPKTSIEILSKVLPYRITTSTPTYTK